MNIEIDIDKCKKDQLCILECPFDCLEKGDDSIPFLSPKRKQFCMVCGHCVAVCPTAALTLNGRNPETLVSAALRPAVQPEDLHSLLDNRRSVRVFRKKKVERELIHKMLKMVIRAPTAKNMQPVSWLLVDDADKIHTLAGLVIDWLRTLGEAQANVVAAWEAGEDIIFRDAPLLIMGCAPQDGLSPSVDCTIAVTSLELAAASCGVGSFWLGYFIKAAQCSLPVRELLELDEKVLPFAALGVGYSKISYYRLPERKVQKIKWL